jgi:hypothetical protein
VRVLPLPLLPTAPYRDDQPSYTNVVAWPSGRYRPFSRAAPRRARRSREGAGEIGGSVGFHIGGPERAEDVVGEGVVRAGEQSGRCFRRIGEQVTTGEIGQLPVSQALRLIAQLVAGSAWPVSERALAPAGCAREARSAI